MFETCSINNFTKGTQKIVVGKSWMMKLRKIDTEDAENDNWHVTAMISYICFLFLLIGVLG